MGGGERRIGLVIRLMRAPNLKRGDALQRVNPKKKEGNAAQRVNPLAVLLQRVHPIAVLLRAMGSPVLLEMRGGR